MAVVKDRFFKKLEHVGEYVVRENLANGVYGPNRRELVEEWLEQFQDDGKPGDLEAEQEDDVSALASETSELPAGTTPSKTWYQRLLGIFGG